MIQNDQQPVASLRARLAEEWIQRSSYDRVSARPCLLICGVPGVASVTETLMEYAPGASPLFGVPLIKPVPDSVKPLGRLPDARVH